jgi:hypothetical protein
MERAFTRAALRDEPRDGAGGASRLDDADPDGARGAAHAPTAWASALIIFAGPGAHDDLAAQLRARGIRVVAIDTKVGGQGHNVLHRHVRDGLIRQIRAREYDFVFMATPCESYSVAHRPQLRSR